MDIETLGGAAGLYAAFEAGKAIVRKVRQKRIPKPSPAPSVEVGYGGDCWVYLEMDRPFDGFGDTKHPTSVPAVLVAGIDALQAAHELKGKSLDWGRLPVAYREQLELDRQVWHTNWTTLREWIK